MSWHWEHLWEHIGNKCVVQTVGCTVRSLNPKPNSSPMRACLDFLGACEKATPSQ